MNNLGLFTGGLQNEVNSTSLTFSNIPSGEFDYKPHKVNRAASYQMIWPFFLAPIIFRYSADAIK